MELLPLFEVSCDLLMEEFVKKFGYESLDKLGDMKESLFLDAVYVVSGLQWMTETDP